MVQKAQVRPTFMMPVHKQLRQKNGNLIKHPGKIHEMSECGWVRSVGTLMYTEYIDQSFRVSVIPKCV